MLLSLPVFLLACGQTTDLRKPLPRPTPTEHVVEHEVERSVDTVKPAAPEKSRQAVRAGSRPFKRQPKEDRGRRVEFNTEAYDRIDDNEFLAVADKPLSTFSVDVDTASYSNVRRFLMNGKLPPKDAVRIEELVNYFPYSYHFPGGSEPFGVSTETVSAPWTGKNRLLRIGIAARTVNAQSMPPRNLTFLVDVSGSMESANKLPLLKRSLRLLVNQLNEKDRLAIVVYAGATGVVLPPTAGDRRNEILAALHRLSAGGPTNGAEGIKLAYETARRNFVRGGINRVILATDGDFNVGTTSEGDLTRLIEKERASGVFLTVLGFGMGNLKDSTMEKLADRGNGNYAYIDTYAEARKVLVHQAGSTLITVAQDVKIQVEFNPQKVKSYRLIGYENRILADRDFNDDTKDAGDVGAGHTVTALYEIVPTDGSPATRTVDPLRYQQTGGPTAAATSDEVATVKVRYKEPGEKSSRLLSFPVRDQGRTIEEGSQDLRFAAGVAAFGMVLRESKHRGSANFDLVRRLAESGRGADPQGYRSEFLRLIEVARGLKGS